MEVKVFQNKPVRVEAVRYDGSDASFNEIVDWVKSHLGDVSCEKYAGFDYWNGHTNIPDDDLSIDGIPLVVKGDWLVRVVRGAVVSPDEDGITLAEGEFSPFSAGRFAKVFDTRPIGEYP